MVGLIASGVLAWRLAGGWALFASSIGLGLVLYFGLLLARRRLHVELGCLAAILLAAYVIGGGHLLHALLLERAMEPGPARWVTLLAMVGLPAGLSLLWAFFNRDRSS